MSARLEERVKAGRETEKRLGAEIFGWKRSHVDHTAKKSRCNRRNRPVPQTDTGRRGENPKVRGKTLVKELGKLHP